MAERILIVEDEDKIADILHEYLIHDGFTTHRLQRGDEVLPWLLTNRANPTDLVVLDLMLPGQSGFEVCRALRANSVTRNTAIIVTTARVDEADRLLGLGLGADDYICKPFSPREVVARVKAVLRRTRTETEPTAAGLTLDLSRWQASWNGEDLGLTAIEFRLLKQMTDHPERIFTREQLIDAMHSDDRIVADRTVDSHIKKIRKKIAEVAPGRELIRSVYGLGYKYSPESPDVVSSGD